MPYRLTKIYTRTGDDGHTSLGKKRVAKDDALIEALGTIDELNSSLGLILAFNVEHPHIREDLIQIQHELFDLGAELIMPERVVIIAEKITRLEHSLDKLNADLPMLQEFLLPGGNPKSAHCHLARTICRRAERRLVHLHQANPLENNELLRYLNRLSDWLFVVARVLARETNNMEVLWEKKE